MNNDNAETVDEKANDVNTVTAYVKPVDMKKEKNPKLVEAGKKGAAARKAKRLAEQEENKHLKERLSTLVSESKQTESKQSESTESVTKQSVTREPVTKISQNKIVTEYGNYITIGFVCIVGLGVYVYFNCMPVASKFVDTKTAVSKVAVHKPITEQDPFEFN